MSPGRGGSRQRGVPTGSAPSLSDGMGTVGTGKAAGAGVAAVDATGRGHGTRGGVLARLAIYMLFSALFLLSLRKYYTRGKRIQKRHKRKKNRSILGWQRQVEKKCERKNSCGFEFTQHFASFYVPLWPAISSPFVAHAAIGAHTLR